MADTYTREELEAMDRLTLRRTCKKVGLSATESAQMDPDDIVEYILEKQGGGGKKTGKKASSKKTSSKKAKSGKDKLAEKRAAKGKSKKEPEPDPDPEPDSEPEDEGGDEDGGNSEVIERLDTLGKIMDALAEEMQELRADVYENKRMTRHLGDWLEAEELLTAENAPDSLGFQELTEEIENELQGNDDGGEDDNE